MAASSSNSQKSYMSSRTEKRREKQSPTKAPAKRLKAIDLSEWLLRILVLVLIVALPWYYGSVQWQSQYILAWIGVVLCGCIALHSLVSVLSRAGDLSVPWLSWLFFAFALVAFVQSRPVFSWQSNWMEPSSISMQRWALGIANVPPSFSGTLLPTPKASSDASATAVSGTDATVPCDLKEVPEEERRLAWSVEPLHTQGAVASMLLCGLFVWLGRMAFTGSRKQLWLFGTLTAIGILIACVGIQGAVSYQSVNFWGLRTGGSFATFVSKNSAGGFYNICIAGCLGLFGWTLLNTQRTTKDTRYRFPDTNIISKIRGFAEDSLADMNTAQIAVALCFVSIVAALLISQCRGAAVSALGAIILASITANTKGRSRGGWITLGALTTAFLACMVGFQLDERAYTRLESLSEIDLEDEMREGRVYIWSIAWKAMQFYGWLGSGLGTFHFAYLPFQSPSSQGWYYHAESLYAQCGVELGYIGVAAMVVAVIKLLAGIQRGVAKENWGLAFPSKLAGAYLLVSQALHSFVDFAIIIPALFVPACVLIGSVMGTLHKAGIAPARKRRREGSSESETTAPVVTANPTWLKTGIIAISVAAVAGLWIAGSTTAIRSLSQSEAMGDWVKTEDKVQIALQKTDRVSEIAKVWTLDGETLRKDSNAMRYFADSLLFNYRMNQLIAAPPTTSLAKAWTGTSPVFLRLALENEQDRIRKEQIVDFVGGKPALELLEKSSKWYALGQTKSPLDWRLLWGRCFTNMDCERSEVTKLLPASLTLAKHNAQQLLSAVVLFREHFDQKQDNEILAQAMKSNLWTSYNSAKLIASERTDSEVPVEIFPPHYEILRGIATEAFPKNRFPKTYKKLWDKAIELVAFSPMTTTRRELWLADAAFTLEDSKAEISHLRIASQREPNNASLYFRLATRLLDVADPDTEAEAVKQVREIASQLKRMDSSSKEAKALEDRVNSL